MNQKIAQEGDDWDFYSEMVRMKGLEPSRPRAYAPKAYVSTNSTTSANNVSELIFAKYSISSRLLP